MMSLMSPSRRGMVQACQRPDAFLTPEARIRTGLGMRRVNSPDRALTPRRQSRWADGMRRTAASLVASAVLLVPGTAQAAPTTDQVVQAVADSAAETYRDTRDQILRTYHRRTAAAQEALAKATDRERAWQEYKRATADARAQADARLKAAREQFRDTVAVARGH